MAPQYIDVFLSPVRDNAQAQTALAALAALMILDFLLGFGAAAKDKDVQSSLMRAGAWHKLGEVGVVVLSDICDGMLLGGMDLGYSAPICTVAIGYLCLNELVSCLENAVKLNPELKDTPIIKLLQAAHIGGADAGKAHDTKEEAE